MKEKKSNWKEFWNFLINAKLSWFWIILAIAANMGYYYMIPNLPGSTAALMSGSFSHEAIRGVIINYSAVLVLQVIVSVFVIIAQAKSVRSVRKTVWKRMMGIEASYYNEHGPNELLSSITSDTEIAISTLMSIMVQIPGIITYLCRAIPMINDFNSELLWSIFVLIPVYIVYGIIMGKYQRKVGMSIQIKIGGLTGYLTDRIKNLTMIKSFVTEDIEEEKGHEVAKGLYKSNISYAKLNSIIALYTILTEIGGITIAVIWGCKLLQSGGITMEDWLAFYLFMPTINTVFRQLSMMWSSFREVEGRTARISIMMKAPQENMNDNAIAEIPIGDIKLNNVDFAYRAELPILKNISLTIPEGKTTALVGYSGSGKTTILRLLEKLYSPNDGSVTIGDTNLNDLNLYKWRDQISYVNQGAEMFGGTIREALTYGVHRKVSDEELLNATKTSGIYDFISSQPNGFDSSLAIWGNTMSGGQRQRMVIARELLKDSKILLLDEPTSALDAETANAISDLFFKGFKGKTIVAVTHELGFITGADQIVVLNEGSIQGVGSHKELMDSCKLYKDLVEEQSYMEVFE